MRKVIVSLIGLMLVGCSAPHQEESVVYNATELEMTDTVSLSTVELPEFEEDFATLKADNEYPVYWGVKDNGLVMWRRSGYPGFDYPMVIEGIATTAANVSLITSWGNYDYKLVKLGYAVCNDEQLIDVNSCKEVITWWKAEEVLVLWSKVNGQYAYYVLVGGTEIVE